MTAPGAVGQPVEGWSPRARPSFEPMQGAFCRVEALDPVRHADALFDAYARDTNGNNWTYLPYGPFTDRDEFRSWVAAMSTGDDPRFHAVVDLTTGRAAGLASYLRIEPAVGVIEVGHINVSPLLQRTTGATEAMWLMMRRVFEELGYRRYEWKCDALNQPSRAAAERLGFTFEGIFRQATISKGRNRDTAWYSVIDSEWPALDAAFRRWLAPANFDYGTQRRRLADLR
ncbi:MAG: GNAT family N-acetyltransferase [Acidimicrobiia bacterium]